MPINNCWTASIERKWFDRESTICNKLLLLSLFAIASIDSVTITHLPKSELDGAPYGISGLIFAFIALPVMFTG